MARTRKPVRGRTWPSVSDQEIEHGVPEGATVTFGAHAHAGRLLIEVQDECGGIPQHKGDLFQAFGDRRITFDLPLAARERSATCLIR